MEPAMVPTARELKGAVLIALDSDDSGTVSADELYTILLPHMESLRKEDLQTEVKNVDKNGSGDLDLCDLEGVLEMLRVNIYLQEPEKKVKTLD
ncbi:unnamed protein product [Dibothriocephalus latus]|uniref:EF-hand domain-containing protein n=1 Tax=Dibothriocephalus latus TaxID=60516 RepID=A0A3P7M1Z9_DIBLA|nr:unnamed protein product [Dibothriocephalus latus]